MKSFHKIAWLNCKFRPPFALLTELFLIVNFLLSFNRPFPWFSHFVWKPNHVCPCLCQAFSISWSRAFTFLLRIEGLAKRNDGSHRRISERGEYYHHFIYFLSFTLCEDKTSIGFCMKDMLSAAWRPYSLHSSMNCLKKGQRVREDIWKYRVWDRNWGMGRDGLAIWW